MSYELLSDGVLAVLLAVMIGYAVILNRRLASLRNLRGEMERLVGEFATASRGAEGSLAELRERAEGAGKSLQSQVQSATEQLDRAKAIADDLHFLLEKGGSVADRLERAIGAARLSEGDKRAGRSATSDGREVPAAQARGMGREAPGNPALLKALDAIR